MVEPDVFIPTSVARGLIARMRITHERRRISIFSGPPGIGKTTAIEAFRAVSVDGVAVVKIARRPAKEVNVLQHTLEAFRVVAGTGYRTVPSSIWELRSYLQKEIGAWAAVKADVDGEADRPRLSFVFDEAQNLSRAAIEVLRYWNDADRCYAPFPVGLIFVGNNEFSLSADATGESAISAAVADRALHIQALEYADVTDADVEMFIKAQGMDDPAARATLIRYLRTSRVSRSFRRVIDLLDDVADLADGQPLTASVVQQVLRAA
jgi:DNA transposition AAA+ family ATPase